ncbi:Structural maintenance of chromosomes protein 6 [Yarrowia sp. B02]|nr:Structural maintenance of chromosomes protein 6 [Yarrowia sp. B02]
MSRTREESPGAVQRPRKRQNTARDEDLFKYHHPGFIRSVECVNFMCHRNLKINVGPGITFVSGQNGHGKSAILTALIQVFSTDRRMKGERGTGSALRRNIEGNKKAKSAKITVQINNKEAEEDLDLTDGGQRGYTMQPFQPETYGDVIIIEREIFEKSKKLRIMNAEREVISEKTNVLLAIMKHFSYQFDNRLVIQTQENAKKRGDPKSLFDFFYNGSGFESIETDLGKLKGEIAEQKACLEASLVPSTQAKKALRDKLKTEVELTAHTKELYDELNRYNAMFKWLEYAVIQQNLDIALNQKVKLETKYAQYKDVRNKRAKEVEEKQLEMEQCKKGDPELDEQLQTASRQLAVSRGELGDIQTQVHTSQRDVRDLEDQIAQLNTSIDKLRAERDKSSANAERERLEAEIEAFEDQIKAAQQSITAFKGKLVQKEDAHKEARARTQEAMGPRNQKESQLREAREEASRLETMSRNKGNPIAGFGSQFVEADRIIQANKSRFRELPLGPLGQYIKIKPGTSDLDVKLINSSRISGMLTSFLVANPDDERTLRSLLPRGIRPIIYRVKPDNYDIERISPDSRFKTILRSLDISEPRVSQALVEWASIHTTALAATADEAVKTLKQGIRNLESMVAPHRSANHLIVNVSSAGRQLSTSRVMPNVLRVGKATVGPEEVARAKKIAAEYETELQPLKEQHRRLEQEELATRREVSNLENERPILEENFRKLRQRHARKVAEKDAIPDAPSTDETDHMIEMRLQEIENSKQQLTEAQEALEHSQSRQREVAASGKALQVELDGLKQRKSQLAEAYEQAKVTYRGYKDVLDSTTQKLDMARAKLKEREKELETLEADMQTRLAAAQQLSEEQVPLDDGVDMHDGFDHCQSRTAKLEAKIKAAQDRNLRDYRVVYAEYQDAEEAYRQAKETFEAQKKDIKALDLTSIDRVEVKTQALQLGVVQTSQHFSRIMQSKAASAEIGIDMEKRKLEVKNYKLTSSASTTDQGARDVSTTSGGEHSYLQAALMSALWKMVDAPIICLDEYEVFMDDATRVVAQKNLVNALGSLNQRAQAILISPTVVKNSNEDDPRFVYVEVRDPSFANRN